MLMAHFIVTILVFDRMINQENLLGIVLCFVVESRFFSLFIFKFLLLFILHMRMYGKIEWHLTKKKFSSIFKALLEFDKNKKVLKKFFFREFIIWGGGCLLPVITK